MAIPKEPRQLMINIMYLVLTALLALNVSAEIFNAFKVVDKGLKASNRALDDANSQLPEVIKKRAQKEADLATYAERVDPTREISAEFTEYVEGIIDNLIDEAGDRNGVVNKDGDYIVYNGVEELKGKKNKDVTTRILVDEGKGAELHDKIIEARAKFLELYDEEDRARAENEISMNVDDETWRGTKNKSKRSWEAFNFKQMPLQATLPMFHKFINDAKSSEAAVLNYLAGKVGGDDLVLDKFRVVSSPKKSYVIKGDPFETELFLSAYASQNSKTDIEIAVNGRALQIDEDGVASWTTTASSTGIQKYRAVANVTNPVTGETEEYSSEFEFEVGERSCNVAAKKMNVFYIGVDNPVSVTAAGISSNQLNVSGTGGGITMTPQPNGDYNVTVTQQGSATITVSGGGLAATNFEFRTKRIPDPVAKLGREKGGAIGNGPFKAQQGLIADLENFDFDARCRIKGFQLVRVAKRQDAQVVANGAAAYNADAKRLINQATPGDRYFFTDVKAECPGDRASRQINDLVFTIR